MRTLISLPPNPAECFRELEGLNDNKFYCNADPPSGHLGSGGGAVWLLEECHKHETDIPFYQWLAAEKRIIIHAGGQSRRLPAYAPSGKILTPVPVFRWERGQRLNQDLLSLQLPLFEDIMEKAPDAYHCLIASGDVYIRTAALPPIPEADVVCLALWSDPITAGRHGVFLSSRNNPSELDYMLQKPSLDELGGLARTHFFLMDVGIWLLSDRAVRSLVERSHKGAGQLSSYDLYSEFGGALGRNPRIADREINALSVKIVPLTSGEFYHFGTGRELISSTLAIQNIVRDQRAIMHRYIKPHPAMFVQNAEVEVALQSYNSELWIENSHVGRRWCLSDHHILTGLPENDWEMALPAGVCIDVVPVGESAWAARPYGFDDSFAGPAMDMGARFMGKPLHSWMAERGIAVEGFGGDIQQACLFPLCGSVDELGLVLQWMIYRPDMQEGRAVWDAARKLSAAGLMRECNLRRLFNQRQGFRRLNLPALAYNHDKSVFYQIDLDNIAREYAGAGLPPPALLPDEAPVMKQIHNRMLRARTLRISGLPYEDEEREAFELLCNGMIAGMTARRESPRRCIYADQIVWARSPVRIDLAGGWTDTPPYCLYAGGNVVNMAIELNGQPPLQVYVKPSARFEITLRSIDLGATEVIRTREELTHYNKVGSPFSIPRAALALAGFAPAFAEARFDSLEEQLKDFGGGLEITLLSAVPAGSGLGTSSILAATTLAALSDCCGLGWDKNEIGNRTLLLEQLLTTGGGWQDQFGGVLHGLKLLQTADGFNQSPLVRWLPDSIFTDPAYRPCHLLYYTGITRTAREILAEIVRGMFLNSSPALRTLGCMKQHALAMFEAIQQGDFCRYGRLVLQTWQQNKALDAGVNPPAIERLIEAIAPYALGYKLPGAGGGGFLYIVAKDTEAAGHIRRILGSNPTHPNARFVEMSLSNEGLQVSRS
ncbi:MAG: bifunctional fucokinase/L-fucose-1-P-guanylyltransferase [Tannerellaceae bacterium]|jgi:galactokinase/mevalonate kinase-like predicted kinase|nr:bifunctional fucokinase/L-fucose-1-P-guanylyltransferase [Tannerellaceae bacterium]